MQLIRYETSRQLDYEPAKLTAMIQKQAIYACSAKHDDATLIKAPKPPEAVEKCLATPGARSNKSAAVRNVQSAGNRHQFNGVIVSEKSARLRSRSISPLRQCSSGSNAVVTARSPLSSVALVTI